MAKIDVPADCYKVKPFFKERPPPELLAEIQSFIAQFGRPHLWRGHTHTKPTAESRIVYVGEFDLPPAYQSKGTCAPCPCCSPEHTKFWKSGKIAWFPTEGVIRMLGPDCFAAINERGHKEALRELREEQEQQRLDAYLQSHLSLVPEAQRALKVAIPIARAVDNARKTLSTHISDGLDFVLWDQVKDSVLRYCDAPPETLKGGRPTKDDMKLYGPAAGHRMLDAKARPLAPELEKTYESFKPIHYGSDHQKRIDSMPLTERRAAAQRLFKGLETSRKVFAAIEDLRKFTLPQSISTMNSWSETNAPYFKFHIKLSGRELYFGPDAGNLMRFMLQEEYFGRLVPLPTFAKLQMRRVA
jgi:hypothetical protein